MQSFTPQLQLETLFLLDAHGRIRSTREPNPTRGPAFALVRDGHSSAWAVNAALPSHAAGELVALAQTESAVTTLSDPPRHADAYVALLRGRVDSGPVFTFPPALDEGRDLAVITMIANLERHFQGWTADEMPDRAPIVGLLADGHVVSVCFCARRSGVAAEAGVETAVAYRGRGFGVRVTSAWARLIRDSGRLPLYSTSWSNAASLSVARKLALSACAADWNVFEAAG